MISAGGLDVIREQLHANHATGCVMNTTIKLQMGELNLCPSQKSTEHIYTRSLSYGLSTTGTASANTKGNKGEPR
jgi:hypothetical protein